VKLEEMSIGEILEKYDFSRDFVSGFEIWCSDKPKTTDNFFGANIRIYNSNPFTKIIKKEDYTNE
jgi:hypothetical protein